CLDCHSVSLPASATQSAVSYRFVTGGTSSNALQWMNHGDPEMAGEGWAGRPPAAPRGPGGGCGQTGTPPPPPPAPPSLPASHRLGNGMGSTTPGINNNMPSGLTASNTLTSASSDPTTGIPAGTHDQITHADVNVTGLDCDACHRQAGPSSTPGIQGAEWA